MMRGGWRPGMEYPDPHRLIEEELSRSTSSLLSPAQQERYKQETGKRTASRKQVVIDNLVAKLDQDLVLTFRAARQAGGSATVQLEGFVGPVPGYAAEYQ